MTLFEMIFDPELAGNGVNAISLVEKPAIESNFIALKKAEIETRLATQDKERRIVLGAVLIPDLPILRADPKTGEEFMIIFSRDTVQQVAEFYMLRGLQQHTTVEHAVNAQGITLVETWLTVDPQKDKSAVYGLDLPAGSWVGAMKVNNDEVWNDYIKTGKLTGFSIEGYFGMEVREEMLSKATRLRDEKPAPPARKTLAEIIEEGAGRFANIELQGNSAVYKSQLQSFAEEYRQALSQFNGTVYGQIKKSQASFNMLAVNTQRSASAMDKELAELKKTEASVKDIPEAKAAVIKAQQEYINMINGMKKLYQQCSDAEMKLDKYSPI